MDEEKQVGELMDAPHGESWWVGEFFAAYGELSAAAGNLVE